MHYSHIGGMDVRPSVYVKPSSEDGSFEVTTLSGYVVNVDEIQFDGLTKSDAVAIAAGNEDLLDKYVSRSESIPGLFNVERSASFEVWVKYQLGRGSVHAAISGFQEITPVEQAV